MKVPGSSTPTACHQTTKAMASNLSQSLTKGYASMPKKQADTVREQELQYALEITYALQFGSQFTPTPPGTNAQKA